MLCVRICMSSWWCCARQALASFSRLRHLDMSYSVAPGHIADVADVVARLPELQQLHLRGIGLSGPLSCELVQAARCVYMCVS